jgi:NTP pyrophosphatase (non-canonical NTP hydrolase)
MTLDEYAAWAAGIGAERRAGEPGPRALREDALGFASEVGELAGVLAKWLRDGTLARDRLADELGDVAYHWARLSVVTGLAPSTLLARSRAHVEWRRAGRPPGGPAPVAHGITLDEHAAWAADSGDARSTDDASLPDIGLALVGDAGEVVECLRRLWRGADRERARLAGELGDVWRYWARLAAASGVASGEILARSRAKIEERLALRGR